MEEDCVARTKDAYYFPHDANARNDPKILAMRLVYGWQGYGWYWLFIEMMREQADYRLTLDKYMIDALAMQMQCERNAVQKFIDDCVKDFQLFSCDDSHLWSESLMRRMSKYDEKSEKARSAIQARWARVEGKEGDATDVIQSNHNGDTDVLPMNYDGNTSRVEESRVEESRSEENISLATLEIEETIRILQSIPGYPADSTANRKHLSDLKVDFPTVHFPTEAKKYKDWLRDRPIKKRSNPRLQFRNWVENAKLFAEKRGVNDARLGESQPRTSGKGTSTQTGNHTQRDYLAGIRGKGGQG